MRSGQKIPTGVAPGEALQVLSRTQAAMLITLANAILQGKIVRTTKDGIHIADENVIFELSGDGSSSGTDNFPFEILQPNTGTADFRNIQVNAGNLWAYPSPEAMAASGFAGSHVSEAVANFNTTLTLPASANIYVYIGNSGGGWSVVATDTDDTTWLDFGSTDNKHFVIAVIDALTNAASQELIVNQYVNEDATWPIGGLFQNTLYDVPLTYAFNYNGARTYVAYSSVVKGTVAQGFPVDGTYLYTGTTADIGPGGNFIAL